MSSVPPVVDYKRMERLRPPENTVIPINANTICVFIILISIIGLYKRHVDLRNPQTQTPSGSENEGVGI